MPKQIKTDTMEVREKEEDQVKDRQMSLKRTEA